MERFDVTVGIIIQARMGSTRLPGKVLRLIAGYPLLDHVLNRLDSMERKVRVVVATSRESRDQVIAEYCSRRGVDCFRGSEIDVLERYYTCARHYGFDHIVRLTADNPFTDIFELERLIDKHLVENNDYTHSFGMMPLGVGAEIFTYDALRRSFEEGHEPHHREHVNEYIQERPHLFKIGCLDVVEGKHCPELRLTVDTEEDYQNACYLAEHAPASRWISTEEAIRLCSRSA